MASRLPIPGADEGQWGQILNDFLSVAHAEDGRLKDGIVSTNSLVAGAVNGQAVQDGAITESKLDTALAAKINSTPSTTLSGDVTGPVSATVVGKISGIAVSGTPAAGQVLKATSASEATWGIDDTAVIPLRTVVTATSNMTASDGQYIVATGAITITLPAAESGLHVTVKKVDDATLLTVATPGSALIDGGSDDWTASTQWVSQDFICDGTNWYLV